MLQLRLLMCVRQAPALHHLLSPSSRGKLIETNVALPTSMFSTSPYSQHETLTRHADGATTKHRDLLPGIEIIVGPMFAGKSTTLLKRMRRYAREGQHVLLLKPASDTRYSAKHVVTHTNDREECYTTTTLLQFKQDHPKQYVEAAVIGIDEGQFFKDLTAFVTAAADHDGKRVVVAGLDGDFKRAKFGQVLDLAPVADEVTKLKARCMVPGCQERALFTQRTIADTRQELVGGKDIYRAVCRKHYISPP